MTHPQASAQRWGMFEHSQHGPTTGNPFTDVSFAATFNQADRSIRVPGFYDGEGVYRVRFMTPTEGDWTFITESNARELDGHRGSLVATKPTGNNHGPVNVAHTFHFAYADGTPYKQIGTTCYAWTHQGDELERQTLETLAAAPFNKIRMCVFPKNYAFNKQEPERYAFEGTPPNTWDTTRFNPEFFRHFERHVERLMHMGIEADVILFHPYDEGRWAFDRMDEESDDRYLRYVVARLAAYRNVWWSMANEFDFMKMKKPADWSRYLKVVAAADPFDHLRSVHNGRLIYDHNDPLVTHVSMQNGSAVEDFGRAIIYRDCYRKPVVYDEVKYEGNIPQRWGNLSPEEMVHRFWQGTIAGTYVGHGETYLHPENVIWWARGGKLYGQSAPRLKFLREVLEASPAEGVEPIDKWQDVYTVGQPAKFYLLYFGRETRDRWTFDLPKAGLGDGMRFTAEVLDTWNMTTTPIVGEFTVAVEGAYRFRDRDGRSIELGGQPWMAIRIRRVEGDAASEKTGERVYGEG